MTDSLRTLVWAVAVLACAAVVRQAVAQEGQNKPADKSAPVWVYVGTYTGPKAEQSKGIYLLKLDPATGTLSTPELAGESNSPSFIALHPSHKYLYAANEGEFAGKKGGAASAFAIDPATGKLTALNQQTSGGNGPCYVAVDPTGKTALVANYGSGSVEALPIGPDGKLGDPSAFVQHAGKGTDPKRQEGPHAHCFEPDPTGRFALACDLGLDKVFVYRLDAANGKLTANDPPAGTVAPGSGPRHVAFHPNGKFVYVINEMASTVTAFAWDAAKGTLTEVQTVPTLPADFKGNNTTAEIAVHPSGKFLYGSNRGHDSIAAFKIDAESGKLTLIGHQSTQGKQPRNFGIDPTGAWLIAANQSSGSLVVMKIDAATGELKPTGATAAVSAPVCVVFLPAPAAR